MPNSIKIFFILFFSFLFSCKDVEIDKPNQDLTNYYKKFTDNSIEEERSKKGYEEIRAAIYEPDDLKEKSHVPVIVLLGGMGAGSGYDFVNMTNKENFQDKVIIALIPNEASFPMLKSQLDINTLEDMEKIKDVDGNQISSIKNSSKKHSFLSLDHFFELLAKGAKLISRKNEENVTLLYSRGPSFFDIKSEGIKIQSPFSGVPIYMNLNASDKDQAHNAADQAAKLIYTYLDKNKNNVAKHATLFANSQGGAIAMDMIIRYPYLVKDAVMKCTGFYPDFNDLKEEIALNNDKSGYEHISFIGGRDGSMDFVFPSAVHSSKKNGFFENLLKNNTNNSGMVNFKEIKGLGHLLNGENDYHLLINVLGSNYPSKQ